MSVRFNLKEIKVAIAVFFSLLPIFEMNTNTFVEWRYRLLELIITKNLREIGMGDIGSCLRKVYKSYVKGRYLIEEKKMQDFFATVGPIRFEL